MDPDEFLLMQQVDAGEMSLADAQARLAEIRGFTSAPVTTPALDQNLAEQTAGGEVPVDQPPGQPGSPLSPDVTQPQPAAPPPREPGSLLVLPGRPGSAAARRRLGEEQAEFEAREQARNAIARERATGLLDAARANLRLGTLGERAILAGISEEELVREEFEERRREVMETLAQVEDRREQMRMDIVRTDIDPRRYWANLSTEGKIASAIGMVLGAIAAPGFNGRNVAVEQIREDVERDIALQVNSLQGKREDLATEDNLIQRLWRRGLDIDEARALATDLIWERVQRQVTAFQSFAQGSQNAGNLQALAGEIAEARAAAQQELQAQDIEAARRAAAGSGPRYVRMVRMADGSLVPVRVSRAQFLAQADREHQEYQEFLASAVEAAQTSTEVDPRQLRNISTAARMQTLPQFTEALAALNGAASNQPELSSIGTTRRLMELLGQPGSIADEALRTPEGQELIRAYANVAALRTFMLSGKQTNEQEVERLARAIRGDISSPNVLRAGIIALNREAIASWDNIRAGSRPQEWQSYANRRIGGDPVLQVVESMSDAFGGDTEQLLQQADTFSQTDAGRRAASLFTFADEVPDAEPLRLRSFEED